MKESSGSYYRTKAIFLTITMLTSLLTVASWAETAEWTYVQSGGGMDLYYDKENLTYRANGVVVGWLKFVLTDPKVAEKETRRRIFSGLSSDGYEDWAYFISQWELDCNLKQCRQRQFKDYDHSGGILDSNSHITDWQSVIPKSRMDVLMRLVCTKKVRR